MRRLGAPLALLLLAVLPTAGAEPAAPAPPVALRLTYVTYAGGFTTVRLSATLGLEAEGYRLAIDYRTVGTVGFLFPGHDMAAAQGTWQAGGAAPASFQSAGDWGGRPFGVLMDYADGAPEIRRLEPRQAAVRESVPAALRQHTIDTVSAMALLFERMANGEGCRLAARVFDGRRLMRLTSEAGGTEELAATIRSFFHGPAEKCDVTGQVLAGFLRSEGPAERERMHRGAVWFAHPIPGLPLLPVRMEFTTKWFGTATMYLTDIRAAPKAAGGGAGELRRLALAPVPSISQEDKTIH